MALQPVGHPDPRRPGPLGRGRRASDPLVRAHRRHVRDFVHEYPGTAAVAQLLHRLLPRAERRGDRDRDPDPEYDELRDGIWVSLLFLPTIPIFYFFLERGLRGSFFGRITPWVKNLGLQNAFVIAALVGLLQALSFSVMVRFGYRLRKASLARYRTYAGEMVAAGLVH